MHGSRARSFLAHSWPMACVPLLNHTFAVRGKRRDDFRVPSVFCCLAIMALHHTCALQTAVKSSSGLLGACSAQHTSSLPRYCGRPNFHRSRRSKPECWRRYSVELSARADGCPVYTLDDLAAYSAPWGISLHYGGTLNTYRIEAHRENGEVAGYTTGFYLGNLLHLDKVQVRVS